MENHCKKAGEQLAESTKLDWKLTEKMFGNETSEQTDRGLKRSLTPYDETQFRMQASFGVGFAPISKSVEWAVTRVREVMKNDEAGSNIPQTTIELMKKQELWEKVHEVTKIDPREIDLMKPWLIDTRMGGQKFSMMLDGRECEFSILVNNARKGAVSESGLFRALQRITRHELDSKRIPYTMDGWCPVWLVMQCLTTYEVGKEQLWDDSLVERIKVAIKLADPRRMMSFYQGGTLLFIRCVQASTCNLSFPYQMVSHMVPHHFIVPDATGNLQMWYARKSLKDVPMLFHCSKTDGDPKEFVKKIIGSIIVPGGWLGVVGVQGKRDIKNEVFLTCHDPESELTLADKSSLLSRIDIMYMIDPLAFLCDPGRTAFMSAAHSVLTHQGIDGSLIIKAWRVKFDRDTNVLEKVEELYDRLGRRPMSSLLEVYRKERTTLYHRLEEMALGCPGMGKETMELFLRPLMADPKDETSENLADVTRGTMHSPLDVEGHLDRTLMALPREANSLVVPRYVSKMPPLEWREKKREIRDVIKQGGNLSKYGNKVNQIGQPEKREDVSPPSNVQLRELVVKMGELVAECTMKDPLSVRKLVGQEIDNIFRHNLWVGRISLTRVIMEKAKISTIDIDHYYHHMTDPDRYERGDKRPRMGEKWSPNKSSGSCEGARTRSRSPAARKESEERFNEIKRVLIEWNWDSASIHWKTIFEGVITEMMKDAPPVKDQDQVSGNLVAAVEVVDHPHANLIMSYDLFTREMSQTCGSCGMMASVLAGSCCCSCNAIFAKMKCDVSIASMTIDKGIIDEHNRKGLCRTLSKPQGNVGPGMLAAVYAVVLKISPSEDEMVPKLVGGPDVMRVFKIHLPSLKCQIEPLVAFVLMVTGEELGTIMKGTKVPVIEYDAMIREYLECGEQQRVGKVVNVANRSGEQIMGKPINELAFTFGRPNYRESQGVCSEDKGAVGAPGTQSKKAKAPVRVREESSESEQRVQSGEKIRERAVGTRGSSSSKDTSQRWTATWGPTGEIVGRDDREYAVKRVTLTPCTRQMAMNWKPSLQLSPEQTQLTTEVAKQRGSRTRPTHRWSKERTSQETDPERRGKTRTVKMKSGKDSDQSSKTD